MELGPSQLWTSTEATQSRYHTSLNPKYVLILTGLVQFELTEWHNADQYKGITRAGIQGLEDDFNSTIIFKVLTRSLESTPSELTDLTGWLGSIYSGPEGD